MTRERGAPLRLFGHPVHAMLVSFPLGLLALLPAWDLLGVFVMPRAALIAYFTELAGLVAAVLAIVTGAVDLARVASNAAPLATGLRHAMFAISAVAVFAVSFALRSPGEAPTELVIALDMLGAGLLLAGAWFGGHLVFFHGLGLRRRHDPWTR